MSEQACAVPLVELLESVPNDARLWVEHSSTHHSHHPVGKHCHDAARRIRELEAKLTCDICGGSGTTADPDIECACGGSGEMQDAFDFLRRLNLRYEDSLTALRAENERLANDVLILDNELRAEIDRE